MTEILPQTLPEAASEIKFRLHNDVFHFQPGQHLHDRETARSQGINAAIIAKVGLPDRSQVAILDFGEEAEYRPQAIHYNPTSRRELPAFGATTKRWGIMYLDNPSDDQELFRALKEGQKMNVGWDPENSNTLLFMPGIHNEQNTSFNALFTLYADEMGVIAIADHSSEGINITAPAIRT